MTPRKRKCLTTVSQVNLGEMPCYPKLYNMGLPKKKRGLGVMIVPCDCASFGVHVIYIYIYKFEGVTGTDSPLLYMPMVSCIHPKCPIAIKRRLLGIFPSHVWLLIIVPMISPFHSTTSPLYIPPFLMVKSPFLKLKDYLCLSNHHFLMVQSC